jgi:hypothetical protein
MSWSDERRPGHLLRIQPKSDTSGVVLALWDSSWRRSVNPSSRNLDIRDAHLVLLLIQSYSRTQIDTTG